MAFDKSTRNRLAKFVADARDVITDEFTEQFQSLYGISSTGEITALEDLRHLEDAGLAIAERLRERIDYLVKTHPDEADGDEMAVKRLAREQAFTILNRFAAVRMAEKRGLIEESVGQGYQSKGFTTFEYVAGSGIGEIYERYRRFLFCLFDELTVDLGVLFDRSSPSSLLFPRETALLNLLELFQASDLERLWEEDETIGWIYQYYNDPDERKKMRKESAAPRNSRELAVRNQFFTPRYVVEFLTDNTLGRIWYEMTRGETRLKEQCRYLVRRPNEIFLKPIDEYGFEGCQEWVQEVLSGNFAAAEPDATWEEMSAVALALDGFEAAEQLGLGDVHDYVRERGDRAIEQGQVDDATLLDQWLLLFSVQRGILREGLQGRDEKYGTAARAVWEAWVRAAKGEAEDSEEESLSQEELLKQPFIIPLRPAKDPREIRLLDPACGSMHFGLYAFDLFEAIYDEAWELESQVELLREDADRKPLRESFDSKDEYLRQVPRLIIEHNIHGVDIDPRAVQIAGLSLWLRAQKSWQSQEVRPADRPRVRRSNIVCAEPMPGSEEMLEEFVETLDLPLLGELVKTVFEKMELAGEAGTLLKIEEEIRSAIQEAKKAWEALESKPQELFSTEELNETTNQPELSALERSLTGGRKALTADFWQTAEHQVLDTLRGYAEQADADSYQRRLFADDAARGFAFIDLCRKRYEAVVMNPPFGDWSVGFRQAAKIAYPVSHHDIMTAFVERGGKILKEGGRLGAITSRTCFFLGSFTEWRKQIVLDLLSPRLIADLGTGVMDSAMVEAAAYILSRTSRPEPKNLFCCRLVTERNPANRLLHAVSSATRSELLPECTVLDPTEFEAIPNAPFAYWATPKIRSLYSQCEAFEGAHRIVRQGGVTGNDERFLRLPWEIAPSARLPCSAPLEVGQV
jgi:hypothetical protein